jgi:hypothetical protein
MYQRLRFFLLPTLLTGCITSVDMGDNPEAANLMGQCFEFRKSAFIYEGRCADLTGFNDNSELCNSVQAVGEGRFPPSWDAYLQNREEFDEREFDKLLFEQQRTMLFEVKSGAQITISRVVHHGWGSIGRYWAVRGHINTQGTEMEIELPSFYLVHPKPYWINGKSESVPTPETTFLVPCQPRA